MIIMDEINVVFINEHRTWWSRGRESSRCNNRYIAECYLRLDDVRCRPLHATDYLRCLWCRLDVHRPRITTLARAARRIRAFSPCSFDFALLVMGYLSEMVRSRKQMRLNLWSYKELLESRGNYSATSNNMQGRSDGGGYIGIYTPKISNRSIHVWDWLGQVLKLQWL